MFTPNVHRVAQYAASTESGVRSTLGRQAGQFISVSRSTISKTVLIIWKSQSWLATASTTPMLNCYHYGISDCRDNDMYNSGDLICQNSWFSGNLHNLMNQTEIPVIHLWHALYQLYTDLEHVQNKKTKKNMMRRRTTTDLWQIIFRHIQISHI